MIHVIVTIKSITQSGNSNLKWKTIDIWTLWTLSGDQSSKVLHNISTLKKKEKEKRSITLEACLPDV